MTSAHALSRLVGSLVLTALLIGSLFNIRLVAPVPPAAAQTTLVVTNGHDDGPRSLRRAVAAATAGDRITFADSVDTVTLTSDQLTIDKTLTIDGGDGVTIERDTGASTEFRIFEITGSDTEVTLDRLTIRNGNTSGNGGGILNNSGTLTVTDSTISDNEAVFGGGIYNGNGTLTVTDSTISDNEAAGGLFNIGSGGGIYNTGTLAVTGSTISGNTTSSSGGGINNGGTLAVTSSTLSNNSASADGGGIYNGGTLTVTNSTFSGNEASDGGGIYNNSGAVTLANTIVANSLGGDDVVNPGGSITGQGVNIIESGVSASASVLAVDPALGPLQDNGGPTLTHAPQSGSPAIDAGVNSVATSAGLTSDQRGFARIVNGGTSNRVDIGAVEVQPTCFATADSGTTVESSADAQALRDALASASSGDTVDVAGFCGGATVAGGGTDNVAVISDPVTVQGGYPVDLAQGTPPDFNVTPDPATHETVLSAQEAGRVLYVNNISGTVTLAGLTIRNGYVVGTSSSAGGIANNGNLSVTSSTITSNTTDNSGGGLFNSGDRTLTVTDSTISGNTANNGSGISNAGMLTVSSSTISGNSASNNGGGIFNLSEVTVTNSTISGNEAGNNGGGIVNTSEGILEMSSSTISDNTASLGGGILNSGILEMSSSTISDNTVSLSGGGITNQGTLTVGSSTISGNTGTDGGGISCRGTLTIINSTISGNTGTDGGGISCSDTLTIINSTISSNVASGSGGGILTFGVAMVTLANTIVANSTSGGDYVGSAPTTQGVNIIESGVSASASVLVIDPALGPLQDNGGPTLTHMPQRDSPAIDAGDNSIVDGTAPAADYNGDGSIDASDTLDTDQRGLDRMINTTVDIGAVEVSGVIVSPTSLTVDEGSTNTYSVTLTSQPTATVTITMTVSDTTEVTATAQITFTTTTWDTPQAVTVTGVADAVIDGDQTATISHSASGGGYDGAIIDEVSVTVRDNDNRIYLPIIIK